VQTRYSRNTIPATRFRCVNRMKKFSPILAILGLTALDSIAEMPLQCTSSGAGEKFIVEVKLTTPHPARMVVKTPARGMIWLRDPEIPFQFPVTGEFENLARFNLDVNTKGTWFNDWSEPEVVHLFDEPGTYALFVADRVSEKGAINSEYSCEFSVPEGDAR